MAKLINKKDLRFENGYILTKDNEIVNFNCRVTGMLNELELLNQQIKWVKDHPVEDEKVQDTFKREFMYAPDVSDLHEKEPKTPLHDKKIEEAKAFMAETDKVNTVADINEWLDRHAYELSRLEESFIVYDPGFPERYDLPTIGNPLKITTNKIKSILKAAAEIGINEFPTVKPF